MPYRRRGYRLGLRRRRLAGALRRRYRRKNVFTGRPRTRTVYRARFMRPEVKKLDTSVEDATIDSGGTIQNLFDPAAGVGQGQYIGEKAQIRYLYWRCVLNMPSLNNDTDANYIANTNVILRVILFVDKRGDSGGTAPGTTEVLETATVTSALNIQNPGRFEIISDRTFTLRPSISKTNGTNFNFTGQSKRFYKLFRRLNYTAGNVTGAVPVYNRLYVLYITDVDEIGSISANARVGYTDA